MVLDCLVIWLHAHWSSCFRPFTLLASVSVGNRTWDFPIHTYLPDSGHAFYLFYELVVKVFWKGLMYFQGACRFFFSLLISLLPSTHPSADQIAKEWELTIRDFTILVAAGQGVTCHAWGEWESCIWYYLESCPTVLVASVIGKVFKCGKMRKG